VNRLAAIGVINVRQGVMNILRFAITNKLAMEFNWAGRDKKLPFGTTQMSKIITGTIHFYQESVVLVQDKRNKITTIAHHNIL
jgi:uncharacterized integral membrane protein